MNVISLLTIVITCILCFVSLPYFVYFVLKIVTIIMDEVFKYFDWVFEKLEEKLGWYKD